MGSGVRVWLAVDVGEDGSVVGYFSPTGQVPSFQGYLFANGFTDLTEVFFAPETYGYQPPPYFAGQLEQASALPRPGTDPGMDSSSW